MIKKLFQTFIPCIGLSVILNHTSAQTDHELKSFQKNFNEVAVIYGENLKPYLRKFSQALTKPNLDTSEQQRYPEALYQAFLAKEQAIRRDAFNALLKLFKEADDYSDPKKMLISSFSRLYMMEFPGLDYAYFDKCESEANARLQKSDANRKNK